MKNYLTQLLPEYKEMIHSLELRFDVLHPAGTAEEKVRYVQSQILRRARRLVDYRALERLASEKRPQISAMLLTHKSWKERGVDAGYYGPISDYLRSASSILDIGCGLNPLYVISNYDNVKSYYCVEPDKRIIQALKGVCAKISRCQMTFFNGKIEAVAHEMDGAFDFAFVQKLIPLLTQKRDGAALHSIGRVISGYALLTCNLVSLSRACSIVAEERLALDKFCQREGLVRLSEFNGAGEFGYVVKREPK